MRRTKIALTSVALLAIGCSQDRCHREVASLGFAPIKELHYEYPITIQILSEKRVLVGGHFENWHGEKAVSDAMNDLSDASQLLPMPVVKVWSEPELACKDITPVLHAINDAFDCRRGVCQYSGLD